MYKAQGHSSSGTIEWDWSKFEVQLESGTTENSAGGGAITSGAHGEHGDLDVPADDILGLPVSPAVAVDGVITRTQVKYPRFRHIIRRSHSLERAELYTATFITSPCRG